MLNLNPFDLERALKGEPVVTRDGQEVTQITLFEAENHYDLVGVVDGYITRFTREGGFSSTVGNSHALDLFMKPKTHIVNGFEVPKPVTEPPTKPRYVYIVDFSRNSLVEAVEWVDRPWLQRLKSMGLVHHTRSDAKEAAEQMLSRV